MTGAKSRAVLRGKAVVHEVLQKRRQAGPSQRTDGQYRDRGPHSGGRRRGLRGRVRCAGRTARGHRGVGSGWRQRRLQGPGLEPGAGTPRPLPAAAAPAPATPPCPRRPQPEPAGRGPPAGAASPDPPSADVTAAGPPNDGSPALRSGAISTRPPRAEGAACLRCGESQGQ